MPAIQKLSRTGAAALALLVIAQSASGQSLLYTLHSPGVQENGLFGRSVAPVGDMDGDGIGDLLVAAPGEASGGALDAGRVHIYSGPIGALIRTVSPTSPEVGESFGMAMADVGDISGDGLPDVLIGAPGRDGGPAAQNAGFATLVLGPSSTRGFWSPTITAFGSFGQSVAPMDDVTGDDTTDYAVGAPGDGLFEEGRVYVFRAGDDSDVVLTLESPDPQPAGDFGQAMARVGDLDGDGIADLLIGAPNETPDSSPFGSGRAYVFSGASGSLIRALASPTPDHVGFFGRAVASAGDIDGDGKDDLLVGSSESPGATPINAGRAYVFSGATGALLFSLASPHQQELGFFGVSVASVGDASGDGVPDLLIGAGGDSGTGGVPGAGRAYLFSGATGTLLQDLRSPNPVLAGRFGWAVAPAGDVNGDGLGDMLIGAFGEDISTVEIAGRAYVFAGIDATAPVLTVGAPAASLWPTNSAYHAFDLASLGVQASDLTDADVSAEDVVITHVTSDEPEDMPGNRDGATTRDITLTFDCRSSSVRSERDNKHNGRIYTVHLAVADAAGNVATAQYHVAAPIRRDGAAIRDLNAYTVTGCDPVTGAPQAVTAPTSSVEVGVAATYELEANAPNPFNVSTRIGFSLPEAAHVRIVVFDLMGREVARLVDGPNEAGRHEARLEAGELQSGTYIYRMEAGSYTATRRLTLVR